jgi:ATP-dependent helicase YprA (DUF1998 family)
VAPTFVAWGLQASFEQLFSHQATALRLLGERKHLVLTTSTSSGKSLVYAQLGGG